MLRFRIIKLRVKIKYEKIQAVQIDRLKVCIIVKDIGNTKIPPLKVFCVQDFFKCSGKIYSSNEITLYSR